MTDTMTASINARQLRPDEVTEVADLLRAHTGNQPEVETLAGWIAASPSAGARCDGALVGFALSQRFAPDLIEMTNLLVAPDHRGRGIGTRLMRALEDGATERGLAGIVLVNSTATTTVAPKRPAAAFYRTLGYGVLLETDSTVVLGRTLQGDR